MLTYAYDSFHRINPAESPLVTAPATPHASISSLRLILEHPPNLLGGCSAFYRLTAAKLADNFSLLPLCSLSGLRLCPGLRAPLLLRAVKQANGAEHILARA